MKILILSLAALIIGGAANAQNIRGRELNQQGRIGQGIRSGQLTPGEARLAERREARLHREIRRDRVDGGGLSNAERSRITRQQNRMSNQIYRLKHNNRTF
jgi:hypothetical protein